jgi:cell division protein FtsB
MESDEPVHFIRRFVSMGDIIGLFLSLLVFVYGYGSLSKDVEQIRNDVNAWNARNITPGAQMEIAQLKAMEAAQNQQILELRTEQRESRREFIDEIRLVGAKLDDHMGNGRSK